MKLTANHLTGVVLGCGVALIGLGVVQGLLHVHLDEKMAKWLENGLFIVAAIAFLQSMQLRKKEREAAGQKKGGPPPPGQAS